MRTAFAAQHFGALHAVTMVSFGGHVLRRDRRREAGPAATGVEFRVRAEQRFAAADTAIAALFLMIPILPAEGTFGVFQAADAVLLGRECSTPFVVAFDNLV